MIAIAGKFLSLFQLTMKLEYVYLIAQPHVNSEY